jgi:peptidoglycan/xylan/chitin deacetylase (PgdA/CDA1 family)
MSMRNRLLAASHYPLRLAMRIGQPLGLTSSNALRVLLYHDIVPRDRARFAAHIRWLARSWTFVSIEQFAAMVSGETPVRGRNVFLTFDDGFASNRVVAEEILTPLGIRALFFVVSDFVSQVDRESAREFIAHRIHPGSRVAEMPAHLYNMGWSDLEALLEQGHSVGAHTQTHPRLSAIASDLERGREIVQSADTLATRLGVPIEHFAYPFGDVASFSADALAMARGRFRFVYSGLRGDNGTGVSPFALRRESVAANDPPAVVDALIEGLADFRYAKARHQLDEWARPRSSC